MDPASQELQLRRAGVPLANIHERQQPRRRESVPLA